MLRPVTLCIALALFSACTDPMTDVERLSDVTVAPDAESAALIAASAATDTPEAVPVAPATGGFLGGLFGGLTGGGSASVAGDGPAADQVAVGTQLPYGEIATVCGVPGNRMGTKIGEGSGYTLYDTIPNATALRTHYITGFPDGCARQFSAALALMGDIGTHEIVRYQTASSNLPFSATDNAYEAIKASYCRVSHGSPCGSRLDALSRRTTFITVYQNFGTNPTWADILIHDGKVVAMDFQGG